MGVPESESEFPTSFISNNPNDLHPDNMNIHSLLIHYCHSITIVIGYFSPRISLNDVLNLISMYTSLFVPLRFLRQEHYTQYGVKAHNCNLFWFVYGYPKPKMAYFFNNEPIDMGGRYDCSYTRNGQATLFINK